MAEERSFLRDCIPEPYRLLGRRMRTLRIFDGEVEDLTHPARRFEAVSCSESVIRARKLTLGSSSVLTVEVGLCDSPLERMSVLEIEGGDKTLAWDAFLYGTLVPSAAASIISVDYSDFSALFQRYGALSLKVRMGEEKSETSGALAKSVDLMFVTAWIPAFWSKAETIEFLASQLVAKQPEMLTLMPYQGLLPILIEGRAR